MKCEKNPEHEYVETIGWYMDVEVVKNIITNLRNQVGLNSFEVEE